MAKLLEELVVVKLSRLVRDNADASSVVSEEQKAVIAATLPALIEEIIGDSSIVIELAELD